MIFAITALIGFGLLSTVPLDDDDNDARDGDDVIDLFDANGSDAPTAWMGQDLNNLDLVDGGSGDDVITLETEDGEVHGGEDDDTLTVYSFAPQVYGGDGDDPITVTSSDSNGLLVEGGEGDDIIDASAVEDGRLNRGAGNDLIIVEGGGGPNGIGYVAVPSGGDRDDIIRFDAMTAVNDLGIEMQLAYGGAGADIFEVSVDKGAAEIGTEIGSGHDHPNATLLDDGSLRIETLTIPDFEPGIDKLVLDATPQNDGYALSGLSLSEVEKDDGETGTDVTLTYESDDQITRHVVISLHATGVTLKDIELLDPEGAELLPLT
ncbi:hypothetical protein [Pseudodonghicola xiamenensis]|uniref:Hemolysin-type calcium-binding repeat-containing protein n=1 Tax=Pseudodonghicola xiamenensis TaxID=337702 RepID=A0A8J3HA86_9RHOB|nr:hypothetical protein [Pseudodonghicola xiamenensis]GHG96901.1 hypothetical protein GCM10010961_31500 [Pseudodonghicola xiamenensis]